MKILKAMLVGLVQGVTEFLPVSSSGHLTILSKLGIAPSSVFYNLSLHLATLLALLFVMRKEAWEVLRHPIRGDGKYILLASLPTVGIAFLFKKLSPELLAGSMLGFGFLLTSAFLLFAEVIGRDAKGRKLGGGISLVTGVMQGIAVLPGVSRSGATLTALRSMGVDADRAARFSFLLSVPVIVGGFLLEGIESGFSAAGADPTEILAAAVTALFSGALAVRFMLRQVKKGLKPFIPYTFALGVLCYFLP